MLRKRYPLFWEQKILSIASWHQRNFIFLLPEGGKAGPREVERGGQDQGMKSSKHPVRLRSPGDNQGSGKSPERTFIMEFLALGSLLPFPSPALPSPPSLGNQVRGFPRKICLAPGAPAVLSCAVSACFGDSHSGDTAPSAKQLVKAGPPRLPHAAPLCTGLMKSPFSTKGFREN